MDKQEKNMMKKNLMALLLPILLTLAVFLFLTTEGWSAGVLIERFCLGGTKYSHSEIRNRCSDSYDKGDYATALREWKPLAEQDMPVSRTVWVLGTTEDKMSPRTTRPPSSGTDLLLNKDMRGRKEK